MYPLTNVRLMPFPPKEAILSLSKHCSPLPLLTVSVFSLLLSSLSLLRIDTRNRDQQQKTSNQIQPSLKDYMHLCRPKCLQIINLFLFFLFLFFFFFFFIFLCFLFLFFLFLFFLFLFYSFSFLSFSFVFFFFVLFFIFPYRL
jgi:hypothetical protein